MDTLFAVISILLMSLFYRFISRRSSDEREFVSLFKDVLEQIARQLQIFLQRKSDSIEKSVHWRPFVVCISDAYFKRTNGFDMTKWISYKYGFGTYIHYINGYLSTKTFEESKDVKRRCKRIKPTFTLTL